VAVGFDRVAALAPDVIGAPDDRLVVPAHR
jgi:hypothetical protein